MTSKHVGAKTKGKKDTRVMLYYAQKLPLPCAQPNNTEGNAADMLEEGEQPGGAEAMPIEQGAQSQDEQEGG